MIFFTILLKSICFIVGGFYLGETMLFWFTNPELTQMELLHERGPQLIGGSFMFAYSIMSIGRSI